MVKFVPVPPPTPEQLEALDAEHDGVLSFAGSEVAPFAYVVRRPTAQELSLYTGEVKKGSVLNANRLFLTALCVYPDKGDVARQIARWPASAGACLGSDRFTEFSGGVVADHQK
jgi:hypothetical protein